MSITKGVEEIYDEAEGITCWNFQAGCGQGEKPFYGLVGVGLWSQGRREEQQHDLPPKNETPYHPRFSLQ